MAPRRGEQLGACPFLDVRGVHDRQPPAPQPHGEDAVEEVERVIGRALRGRVVGDDRSQRVRREDLGRREVPVGEGALATRRDADEQDERIGREESVPGKRTGRL